MVIKLFASEPVISELHFPLVLTFLGEWWGKLDIKFYGKKEDYELVGKEHALVLPNHRSDIDWMIGWIICERTGILGVSILVSFSQDN
jgi:lysophosphatidic acid acyltransferase/lysophosphatidylinositol acyltransferase